MSFFIFCIISSLLISLFIICGSLKKFSDEKFLVIFSVFKSSIIIIFSVFLIILMLSLLSVFGLSSEIHILLLSAKLGQDPMHIPFNSYV